MIIIYNFCVNFCLPFINMLSVLSSSAFIQKLILSELKKWIFQIRNNNLKISVSYGWLVHSREDVDR